MNKLEHKIINEFYRLFFYPINKIKICKIHSSSVEDTIKSLINTNKSLSRFGDGEMRRILGYNNLHKYTADRFEKNSLILRNKLIKVLESNQKNLEIGIPHIFYGFKHCNAPYRRFSRLLIAKYGAKFMKYLNYDKRYYNSCFSRFYMGDITNKRSSRLLSYKRFKLLKKIWKNKKILIIEGNECRIGLNNNLFDDVKSIKRVECPAVNAFESYGIIFDKVLNYLNRFPDTLCLISLGPTATILSYDLTKQGFRAIDMGQVDIEYEWYLMKAKHVVNIPNRYVSEATNGNHVTLVHNRKFLNEIIYRIK